MGAIRSRFINSNCENACIFTIAPVSLLRYNLGMVQKRAAALFLFFPFLIFHVGNVLNAQESPSDFQNDDIVETEKQIDTTEDNSFWKKVNWAVHGGILFFTGNEKQGADPSPVVPSLGVSASYSFNDQLKLEIAENIYVNNYEYNTALEMPLPCNLANRSALVIGFLTSFQVVWSLPWTVPVGNTEISFRAYAGPAIDIRIAFLAMGLNHPDDFTGDIKTDPKLQTDAIGKYFWNDGHWFYPVIGIGADYPINEKFLLGLDLRLWIPLSTSEDLRFGVGLRFTPRKNI